MTEESNRSYNPGGRDETPEEKLDRLIEEILKSPNPNPGKCADLKKTLQRIPDAAERKPKKVSDALKKCGIKK